ncbi:flagellar hook assembly protein FlgD [Paraferrimonas sedimenticola]|uniref:Basal-body rod modification protein FlgD n=1 Tax=Paraferrimonas sedimenticola TaxID=375674 RepID=A0AA37W055_9GAMM|nr:flagellar hook assembly protein FlgD [Paraferrimonas sedimenticola]GLP94993.1 basal-body rod modification protein FlgD [Paraferrimonas sedimenticola]
MNINELSNLTANNASGTNNNGTNSTNNNQSLTQEDFFALLTQQLSMQDPSNPVDNDQMISQMASFATVDGINQLNGEIANLNSIMTSSQALQASSLVGQKVLIPSASGYIGDGNTSIKGVVTLPSGGEANKVRVEDENGQLVAFVDIPAGKEGNVDFEWDGLDSEGNAVEPGMYTFKVEGTVDGESQELPVSTYAHVSSVSLGTPETGAILNLRGIGGVLLGDVLAVAES